MEDCLPNKLIQEIGEYMAIEYMGWTGDKPQMNSLISFWLLRKVNPSLIRQRKE